MHVLGRNFFPKHGLYTKDQGVYVVFPFFDCWDFPTLSTLGGGKRRHGNMIAVHERAAMSAEELINLQHLYPDAS